MNEATRAQNRAAEPTHSTWLSANAGSGKTRVLTDRVARLLLDGVDPQSILCLTYTKAAASEMQNRLFKRLGEWSMRSDGALAEELQGLGVSKIGDKMVLARARRLFARAIETPGGLRIQTIHSFCASLLRKFPLEAGVSPAFVEMDDRNAVLLRDAVLDEIAEGQNKEVLADILHHVSGDGLLALADNLVRKRDKMASAVSESDVFTWFGLPPGAGLDHVWSIAFDGSEPAMIKRLLPISNTQSDTYRNFGEALAALQLNLQNQDVLDTLYRLFLYASGEKRNSSKSVNFPQSNHKKAVAAFAPVLPELHAFMDRIASARDAELRIAAALAATRIHRFARVFLPLITQQKETRGWLDFDDQILKTRGLLSDDKVALWVLYKLDGGLDHILVDEAQDTSPEQWQVIERLAQEMTAGAGTRGGKQRTIFVVGDKKQSIYSFQGADPRAFDTMRKFFRTRLSQTTVGLRKQELAYSFRSSAAILKFVDTAIDISEQQHRAYHESLPGRVDLWPVVGQSKDEEPANWYDPVDLPKDTHHSVVLARKIAERLKWIIDTETIPAESGETRPVKPGDIMILVRRRKDLFQEIIRACKAIGLPIAGADRLKLGNELPVQDVVSLLTFLATPEDNLALAEALRSHLFGWSEGELYELAAGRAQPYLWQIIRGDPDKFHSAFEILSDLRNSADFLRPYDLIERILIRHDGRRRLLARFGSEAQDGLDALLAQALVYERGDSPSLTGFLAWLASDDVEIKRQMDGAGDEIRVMTVHGAKGLESPIVVLPDTAKRTIQVREELLEIAPKSVVLKVPADEQPELIKSAVEKLKVAQREEDSRLFYVAATRAETWLIIAAAGDVGAAGESWHQRAEKALKELDADPIDTPTGEGMRYSHGVWAGVHQSEGDSGKERVVTNGPNWLHEVAEIEARPTQTRAPSALGGAKAIWRGEEGKEDGTAHGTAVHTLLERLVGLPRDARIAVAKHVLPEAEGNDFDLAFKEAAKILDDPKLSEVFGADGLSEVEVTAKIQALGGNRVVGAIDRLIVSPKRVLAVDYKTNAVVPSSPKDVPEGILRQMGAYLDVLMQVYPGRTVDVAILWTKTAALMPLPHEIVSAALSRTTTS